jgi:tetratricopeptide (TPR) repeat protein
MENIRTSDSPYRFARLTELINEDLPIDVSKAASILRDHKGLQNTDLGLANEMAINQFIAHHSVIFQPEKQLMWVSTSPWQCGKYVAYDLNKIFKDTIDWQHEIYSSALTIPEDKFIDAPEFQHLLTYKKLTPLLLKKIRKKEKIEESVLKTYQASNPSLYYVYEVIGDYYEAMQQPQQAIAYWQQALKRPIPKLQEKERIQQKIQKQS